MANKIDLRNTVEDEGYRDSGDNDHDMSENRIEDDDCDNYRYDGSKGEAENIGSEF